MTATEHKLDFKLTTANPYLARELWGVYYEKDFKLTTATPYLALTGELWGVYYENFQENWPCYNGTQLYKDKTVLSL